MFEFLFGLVIGVMLAPWLGPPMRRGVDWIMARMTKEKADGQESKEGG
jgi:hypothetical protein